MITQPPSGPRSWQGGPHDSHLHRSAAPRRLCGSSPALRLLAGSAAPRRLCGSSPALRLLAGSAAPRRLCGSSPALRLLAGSAAPRRLCGSSPALRLLAGSAAPRRLWRLSLALLFYMRLSLALLLPRSRRASRWSSLPAPRRARAPAASTPHAHEAVARFGRPFSGRSFFLLASRCAARHARPPAKTRSLARTPTTDGRTTRRAVRRHG